ncbi:flavodoxin reductases (ferredoxin-NADPH reductases) family 1 [Geminocystis sp. NIES-3708]|uniref:Uma2 family endonuclease n=1 Tax=Geminocystis sp. NIES-3708 TaxID=1615909 RepID=UPI0005FC56A2|nr:flavodoxin reductases (ferredoxin-NADPH reductases) family 1 [Geminocystis sp. NIES-3708]
MLTKKRADRVLLYNIDWQQFENILIDLGQTRSARIAYDNGILEIMNPLPEHEYYKENIGDCIKDIAEVLERDYENLGSTTWRKQAKMAGIEPDNCFYFQNEAKIRGKLDYDLNQDPPPDLALEIDLTSKSLNRFPIYVRLGIPEVWCYDEGLLKVYLLQNDETYQESRSSLVFPDLPVQEIPEVINQYRMQGRRKIRQEIRKWALTLKI